MTKEERAILLERRAVEFPQRYPNDPDFYPADGRCQDCGLDLVERCGDRYPIILITGCPKCHRSYCD